MSMTDKPKGEKKKMKKLSGHPVQIIDIDMIPNQPSRMNLKPILNDMISEYAEKNVALFSIAGPSRLGKSFLLSYILKYLSALENNSTAKWLGKSSSSTPLEGFPFQNGMDRHTVGMWIWSRPFLIKNERGEEVAVFVMDTQGVFDDHTTNREWSAIVGLSLLTSSCLIYNVLQNLQEDALSVLENFIQYGILAMKEDETGAKCFQKLTFLIRDWNMPDDCDYGPVGGEKFLEKRLKIQEHLPDGSKRIRNMMKSCFEEISCFLMPEPGKEAKSNDFKGSLKELDPTFIECLSSLMGSLLSPERIKAKKLGGQLMKGKNLFQIFQRYVDIFNSDEMPTTVSLLEATAHTVCETMVTKIKDRFIQQFGQRLEIGGFLNEKEFNSVNEMLTKACLLEFNNKRKFGDEKIAKKHRKRLESDLAKLSAKMKNTNEDKKIHKSDSVQENFLSEVKTKLSTVIENNYLLHEDLDIIIKGETNTILAAFCNTFDNNKAILENFVPIFQSRIQDLVNTFHEQNDEKINKAKEVAKTIVSTCFTNYENDMNFKLLQAPNTILNDEFILNVESILRKQALNFFDANFKIPSEKLSAHFKTDLEILMNTMVENIAKSNTARKMDQISRVEALIDTIVDLYETDMSNALLQQSSPDNLFLQSQHFRLREKYSDIFQSQSGISDLNILSPFNQTLKSRLEDSLAKANSQMIEIQTRKTMEVQSQIKHIREEYINSMLELVTKPSICTEQELNNRHNSQVKKYEAQLFLPEFLNNQEKNEFRCKLVDDLNQEFDNVNDAYQNKLLECSTDMNNYMHAAVKQYKSKMENHIDELMEISDLENKHKDLIRAIDESFSQKTQLLPENMDLQYRQRLEQLLCKEFTTIADKFAYKKQEIEHQAEIMYAQAISQYSNEINQKLSEVSNDQILTQWHQVIKTQCLQQFKNEIKTLKIESENMISNLDVQITKAFQKILQESQETHQELEHRAIHLVESVLEGYKQKIEELLMSDTCENESMFQQRESSITKSIISQYEQSQGGIPINIFLQKKESLISKISSERQTFFQMFREKLSNELEAKETIKPQVIAYYKNLMEEFLRNNSNVSLAKLKEMHETFLNSAVQTIPPVYAKSMFGEAKNQMSNLHLKYEEDLKTQLTVEKTATDFLKLWKNKIDADVQSESLRIFNADELKRVREGLIHQLNEKLTAVKAIDESRKCTIFGDLEQHLEKSCSRAREAILKREPDRNAVTIAHSTAVSAYEREMTAHLGPSDFVNPKALETFHKEASKTALQTVRNQKLLIMTPKLERELNDLFKNAFKKYEDTNQRNMPVNPAIGIDLGTTYSCVAVYNAGKVIIIPNDLGKNTTPSYVSFDGNGGETVGAAAKDQAHLNPENTIFDAKRLIGREYNDPIVQADIKQWPFKVADFGGMPKIKVNNEAYWPEEISAKILKKMKQMAEKHLGLIVENAVITVPAYFNDGQKQATINAGRFAGLNVLGILNEPTAAAVAYSLNYACEKSRTVLIFDFGGGTFDIAVLSIHNGEIIAKAVDGDTHLGGEDFDSNMVNYCVRQFNSQHNFDLLADQDSENLTKRNVVSKRIKRLRGECERQKINLTSAMTTTVNVEAIYADKDLKVEITRETFETINKEILEKTLTIVKRALEHAKIKKEEVDDIVLVGGSTRIPKVQSLLQTFFDGKALNLTVNADEAVAHGAAIHAAILNGAQAVKLQKIKLTDVAPLSIGVEIIGGVFSPIIPKNTPVPTKMTQNYFTASTNQRNVRIAIYEGEEKVANKNHLLGEFELDGIPPGPAGSQKIDITMKIDINGILNVEGVCTSGNVSKNLTIVKNKGRLPTTN